ncbi:UNVERIFIED_CONTAM: hypothetical protein Scaly_2908000 [Sesamum calycinum]|uniref:Reverse transcriptase domain-containing protein n=1 Tax=Sesamum calycinum TaxID=2727403 RepID=A0AAW2L354_9LAMI
MDEGEDGDLVNGSHGATSAAPATFPLAGGGAIMVNETEHGELHVEGHGVGPTVPTTPTTAECDLTLEKLKAEFNIKEFLELASRVLDDGDSESMEISYTAADTVSRADNTSSQAWFSKASADQAALFSEAPSSCFVKPQSPRAAHQLLAAETFEASTAASHWGPLAASASHSSAAPAAVSKSTDGNAALGTNNAAGKAVLGPNNAAPPSCHAKLQMLTSFGTLKAAACGASTAASPPTLLPKPLTDNSMDAEDEELRRNHDSLTTPSPPRTSPPSADAWEVEVVDNPFPAMVSVPVLNGQLHCQSPAVSFSPLKSTTAVPYSLKTTAPPLLDTKTVLPCSKVDETAAVQQSQPAVTAAARGGMVPPCLNVAETVPAAAGVHSPMSSTGIFIGNVPLNSHGLDFSCDTFATSFNNSTRKTLSYVNPSIQNGEIVVRPSIDIVREGSRRWENTAVGYFLGRKPYYHHLNDYVRSVWPAVKSVTATSNGFYFFQFNTEIAMEEVIEGGPWLFQGQPIVLQRWEPGMVLRLSTVASGVGRPLYQDTITRACTRLDFARVCVMLDISSTLPKHLIIMMPKEDGTEVPCKKRTMKPPVSQPVTTKDAARTVQHEEDEVVEEFLNGVLLAAPSILLRDECRHLERSGSQPARPSGGGEGARIRIQTGLWQKLVLLANSISDEPWIVGGDFNTVLDMSEVCGSSADIHLAMTEFRDCLLDTGLIHLPVQGERFSWHNCSEGDRSLWKRLDRLLVNDAWLSQWPNSHYHCLNARTSDHSPLVIRGDTATTRSSYKAGAKHAATTGKNPMAKGWRSVLPDLLPKGGQATSEQAGVPDMNETGRILTEHDEVVDEFVSFYQRLLGGERRREFLDLRYLRPWARHVVTPDECMELVQSVTREEIKDAFFDIAEDKAPGPDGYSFGFYKAAWPVIGEEVVKAILEFFTTGRLLKQVNTTILALIPKVRVPSLVSDFRPISCCNVLYKVITKIIVQRLRSVLDKMISPSQNAFVPGRSIGDNILLAQEIFSGYNRQGLPMRCALKVDLRKAYDTVEWDFLSAVLHLFGFPDIFIGWIEECVTTPMFSVCINGNPHGFFKGSRGLRQGDPMSPFLFV